MYYQAALIVQKTEHQVLVEKIEYITQPLHQT